MVLHWKTWLITSDNGAHRDRVHQFPGDETDKSGRRDEGGGAKGDLK